MLGIITYLQIFRSVSADEFLMGMHIRETGSLTRTGLSHLGRSDRADGPEAVERMVFDSAEAKRVIGSKFLVRLQI